MNKLRLDLDAIQVESFATDALARNGIGTVRGRDSASILLSIASPLGCGVTVVASCFGCTQDNTCPDTCDFSEGASCGPACHTRKIGTCTCTYETYENVTVCKNTSIIDEAEAEPYQYATP